MTTKTRDEKPTFLRIVQKHELARGGGGLPPTIIDDGDGGGGGGGDDGDDSVECREVEGFELRVGDVIRCRPYRGIPNMPRFCAQGRDVTFTIGRIEPVRLGGNQRYRHTLVILAVELHEVLYIGEYDVVNLVRREAERQTVVQAKAVLMPEVRRLPAPRKELP